MKENVNDIELIEQFLDGKLPEQEKEAFEKKKTNAEFKSLMTDMEVLVQGIRQSAGKTSTVEKLERLKFFGDVMGMEARAEEENPQGTTPRVVALYQKPKVWAMAAGIALLITAGAYFTRDRVPLHERVYMAYFEPFDSPGAGLTRGSANTPDGMTLKAQAYLAYDNERYAEAVKLFNDILAKKDDPIIHLCLGNAQLKLGDYEKAESTFSKMLEEHDDLVTQTRWYLALTYLRQNKLERAKAMFWEVSKGSTYGEKARKILKELE